MKTSIRYFIYLIRQNKNNGSSYSQLKHYFKWKRSLNPESSSVKDEQPWITYDAIDFLKLNINSASKVFEYGGGGSSLFFVKRVKEVITVEHDLAWFQKLSQIINEQQYSNWKGSFVFAQKGDIVVSPDKANPEHYSSEDEKSIGYNYKDYVSFIDNYSDNYFDVVLVDGRSRVSCIKHSISKIKQGGFLILDNSDRNYYVEQLKEIIENNFEIIIDNYGASPYSQSFTKTTVWRKK